MPGPGAFASALGMIKFTFVRLHLEGPGDCNRVMQDGGLD